MFRKDRGTLANVPSIQTGITATAGGGQANAYQLTTDMARISTVATAADSVRLPPALAGATVCVKNGGANSAQVFGYGTDTINGVATATGVALAAGKVGIYACFADGNWELHLSA